MSNIFFGERCNSIVSNQAHCYSNDVSNSSFRGIRFESQPGTEYPDWGLSYFSSISSGECYYSNFV